MKILFLFFLFYSNFFSNPIQLTKFRFSDYENSLKLSNNKIEMIILTDIGPRIIHFSIKGKENLFYIDERFLGKKGEIVWRNYGGHRLWIAPETKDLTYVPDNDPIQYYWNERVLTLVSIVNGKNLQKEIIIQLDETESKVKMIHRVKNLSNKNIKIALWSISVMDKNGIAKLNFSELGIHPNDLLPKDALIFWKYTKLNDTRINYGEREIIISNDSSFEQPVKIGIKGKLGLNTIIYEKNQFIFSKKYSYFPNQEYADLKASSQVFSNQRFIELETLSPLKTLKKNEIIEHIEEWEILTSKD